MQLNQEVIDLYDYFIHSDMDRRVFLDRLGLAHRAERLMREAEPDTREAVAAAARRLAGIGAGEMGALFKVLVLAHPALGAPPAFDPSEEFRP